MDKVLENPSTGCSLWIASKDECGYGCFRDGNKMTHAHRWIYEYYNGPLGDLYCLHKCNNPSCVNIDHLEAGTQKANMEHCVKSGNNYLSNKEFCPKGHPYNVANTRIYRGYRYCLTCQSLRSLYSSNPHRPMIKIN